MEEHLVLESDIIELSPISAVCIHTPSSYLAKINSSGALVSL